jgi:hypothetical protein
MTASAPARETLEELSSQHPGDVHLLALRCQAATALEDWDLALDLAERTSQLASSRDVGDVQRAQILIAAGRKSEALEALNGIGEDNVVASSLRAMLEFFGTTRSLAEATPSERHLALPQWSLWFEPVLSALLLELEQHLATCSTPEIHRARTVLIRPNLEPSMFRSPKPGLLERLFSGLSSAVSCQRQDREREVVGYFYREDLEGAAGALRSWIQDVENAYDSATDNDPRHSLLMETYFALGRFSDMLEVFERRRLKTKAVELPERHLAAYSYLCNSNERKARKALADGNGEQHGGDSPDAATAHLVALCELKANHRGAALSWLRRAVSADDIGMVDLAYELLAASCISLND